MISHFTGDNRFLSNNYPAPVRLDEVLFLSGIEDHLVYPTVEHAYQAAKSLSIGERREIQGAPTPHLAKAVGHRIKQRDDFKQIRLPLMEHLLRQKFEDPDLRTSLLATGDQNLIEGTRWGEDFWGMCRGVGENHLGRLLMKIRSEIQNEVQHETNRNGGQDGDQRRTGTF